MNDFDDILRMFQRNAYSTVDNVAGYICQDCVLYRSVDIRNQSSQVMRVHFSLTLRHCHVKSLLTSIFININPTM